MERPRAVQFLMKSASPWKVFLKTFQKSSMIPSLLVLTLVVLQLQKLTAFTLKPARCQLALNAHFQ